MTGNEWLTKRISVASLHLDSRNPRLSRSTEGASPRELIQYLFEHDKAMEVAESIASRGFFPNEPLLAIKKADHYVVVDARYLSILLFAVFVSAASYVKSKQNISNKRTNTTNQESLV